MTSILLIYPFFIPRRDRSVFRFPPLGIAYIAASLRKAGHAVTLLDCTFLKRDEALARARQTRADVVGIYAMVTLLEDSLWFARGLRSQAKLLIAGGPLPTCSPERFADDFDVIVRGEGEQTIVDLLQAFEQGGDFTSIHGIAYRAQGGHALTLTPDRPFAQDLDRIPFPARDLLPNPEYIRHGKRKYGASITSVMSTRGCPYRCEFCSNVVFGGSYRERSPGSIVDEIEEALAFGYDRISFADDVFTLHRARVLALCDEILRRGLHFHWECLGRVDSMDSGLAEKMKQAGCTRIYFGIESANERILQLMNKRITPLQARQAVECAHQAGLEVGAFFILFYPGDTDETVLQTLHFASSLPLDYLGLSMPYPLPGADLYDRVGQNLTRDWRPGENLFSNHVLIYKSDFSERKVLFGILKGQAQFRLKKAGRWASWLFEPFEKSTDVLLKWMG